MSFWRQILKSKRFQGLFLADASNSHKRQILINAAWLYLDQGIRLAVGVFTFSVVARYLGADGFGILAFATAYPSIFLPLAKLGLDYVVVQELVRRRKDTETILATAASLMTVAGIASMLLALVCTAFIGQDNPAIELVWITVLVLVGQPLLVFDFYFQSRIASRNVVMTRLSANLFSNLVRIIIVFAELDLIWFAWLFVFETILVGFGLLIVARRSGISAFSILNKFCWIEARHQIRESWPLLLSGLAMAGYLKFDQILLSRIAGVGELGLYAAAMRFADIGQLVTYTMINSYYPRFVELHAIGDLQWKRSLERFWSRITWLGILVASATTIAAPMFVEHLLGENFSGAALPLVLLAWGNVFAAQVGVRGKWFFAEGLQRQSLLFFICGAALHIGCVLYLAMPLGATGAALSYFAAQVAMALVFPLFFAKTRSSVHAVMRSFNPFLNAKRSL